MTGLNAVCPSTVSTPLHNSEVHEAVCTTEFYTEYIYVNLSTDPCCVKVLICKIFGSKQLN